MWTNNIQLPAVCSSEILWLVSHTVEKMWRNKNCRFALQLHFHALSSAKCKICIWVSHMSKQLKKYITWRWINACRWSSIIHNLWYYIMSSVSYHVQVTFTFFFLEAWLTFHCSLSLNDNHPLQVTSTHLSVLHHWPALALPSPPPLAAASARPALPWRAAAPPPAGSRRSDSPSSGRSACGLWDTTRRRGSDSGRIWGCASSCAVSAAAAAAAGALMTGSL